MNVRGEKVSRISRNEIDLVIIAARYQSDSGSLSILQGYERHGPIWGDVQLFTRERLIGEIQQGKRAVTGRLTQLPGDFEVEERIRLREQNGDVTLFTGDDLSNEDKLNVPLF